MRKRLLMLFLLKSHRLELLMAVGFVGSLFSGTWNWWWFLSFWAAKLVRVVIGGTATTYASYVNAVATLRAYRECSSRYKLEPLKINDLPGWLQPHLRFPRTMSVVPGWRQVLGLPRGYVPLEIYRVVDAAADPFPQLKTYSSLVGPTIVLIRDIPAETAHPTERFEFLHELGHASVHGMVMWSRGTINLLTILAHVIVLTVLVPLTFLNCALIGLYVTFSLLETRMHRLSIELKADAFALNGLGSRAAIEAVLEDHNDPSCLAALAASRGVFDQLIEDQRIKQMKRAMANIDIFGIPRLSFGWDEATGCLPDLLYIAFIIYCGIVAATPEPLVPLVLIALAAIFFCGTNYYTGLMLKILPVLRIYQLSHAHLAALAE